MIEHPLRTANGLWLPDRNLIILKRSMRSVHKRNALAHEVGHVELGHEDDRPKHEAAADRYASLHLIHPAELEQLTLWTDDQGLICQELGVTQRLLAAYLDRQAG